MKNRQTYIHTEKKHPEKKCTIKFTSNDSFSVYKINIHCPYNELAYRPF